MTSSLSYSGQRIELFIFDFDGTIANTSSLHRNAFQLILRDYDCTLSYDAVSGMTTEGALRVLLSSSSMTVTDSIISGLVRRKQEVVREMIRHQLLPIPGVDKFLRFAKSKIRISLATSGSRLNVGLALSRLGYTDWFDPLVCGDDVSKGKPEPDIFLRVLSEVGCLPERALVFEDSVAGFTAAERAGLNFIDVRDFNWDTSNFK